jgi:hypothetical protein
MMSLFFEWAHSWMSARLAKIVPKGNVVFAEWLKQNNNWDISKKT